MHLRPKVKGQSTQVPLVSFFAYLQSLVSLCGPDGPQDVNSPDSVSPELGLQALTITHGWFVLPS